MKGYVKTMRQLIGDETLFTVGCGAIVEDDKNRILLQRRRDSNNWCCPGGIMEVNETFKEAAKREVEEETGLIIKDIELFGIYSGPSCFVQYPNGDKAFSVQVIFICRNFKGQLKQDDDESFEHRFFDRFDLPEPLASAQASFLLDWAEGKGDKVIVK